MEDFEVVLPAEQVGKKNTEKQPAYRTYAEVSELALAEFNPAKGVPMTVLSDNSSSASLDQAKIEEYALSPQSDLTKTREIINIVRQYVNKNDIIGAVVDIIESNINTETRLKWRDARQKGVDKKVNEEAKKVIEEFHEKINIHEIIRTAVISAYRDGTYIMYLRQTGAPEQDQLISQYAVDDYPIGVATITQYSVGQDPWVQIDMTELKARLRKTYTKNKKGRGLYYDDVEKELKATYPAEVVKAYRDGERYCKLEIGNTGVLRLNNQGKQYGLSPIFRALTPVLMLETFQKADRMSSKARAKKIIAQYLNKEILGENYDKDGYKEQAYAHKTLVDAWRNPVVVVTPPATVRSIEYVEPKVDMTSIETISYYRMIALSTLGILFLMDNNSQSLGVAQLSIKQLMRFINKVSQQLEQILHKWYGMVLEEAGIDAAYAPTIEVLDAEFMEQNVKFQLAQMLYSTMNLSFETVLDVLGYDVEDERAKRERENEEGITNVFAPRPTAYTMPADSGDGDNTDNGKGNGKGKDGDGKGSGNGDGGGGNGNGSGNGNGGGQGNGRTGQVGKNANQIADPTKKRGRPKTSLDEDKSLYDSLRYQNSK